MKYDIIIPTIFRDYPFLRKIIQYIYKNLDPDNIYIITNGKKSQYLPQIVHEKCIVLDEDALLKDLSIKRVYHLLYTYEKDHSRPGWYFQQFLKMAFALTEFCKNEYYLSWDSDTLPLQHIDFFDAERHPLFTMKSEHHQPYFNSIKRLLNIDEHNSKSYIAEHMLFNREIMKEVILKIEQSTITGSDWIEKIINSIDKQEFCGFSEFETYGNFCATNYPNVYHERELATFRYGGYIQGRFISDEILEALAFDLSIVTFEAYHTPPFPWGTLCNWYNWYIKKRERAIDKWGI